ncbi:hypothetical protein AAS23_gp70 [Pantoea phage vB_PagS_AAS23]|uniref:Uncharacterized protein n=1 Tax=Pantoea phage vB_PagS_AAS23 TaxID=2499073 RepID=A0A3S9U808_9CAUD|nr:hypothetical protein HOU93_gp70 [Pantoea phage vB_PagS_AAS23]AZS06383.1 hypothetical protein AAS23_gp70 [Pantoea phage vB_PagS_AAS23]
MAKKRKPNLVLVNPGQHDQHVLKWYLHLFMTKSRPEPGAFIGKIML